MASPPSAPLALAVMEDGVINPVGKAPQRARPGPHSSWPAVHAGIQVVEGATAEEAIQFLQSLPPRRTLRPSRLGADTEAVRG